MVDPSIAGLVAAVGATLLLALWWWNRPLRGCRCGRCRASKTVTPRCVIHQVGMRASLQFQRGPMAGMVVPLEQRETSIGSVADNTIVLADPAVSRRHAVVRRNKGAFSILQEEAKNGLFVNGKRRRSFVLACDDVITIGNSEMIFVLE